MATLIAKARNALSWDFGVYQDDVQVADIDGAWLRERAVLTVGDAKYKASRVAGAFELTRDKEVLVRAEESGFDSPSFTIAYGESVYRLRAKPGGSQVYQLAKDGGSVIGTFQLEGIMARQIEAQLPDDLPLVVRVFILWLVILAWKRASRAT